MRFENPHMRDCYRTLKHFILWKMGCYDEPLPHQKPPADFLYPAQSPPFQNEEPSALWIGHSTFLIEVDGINILTDPIWDSYCSPLPIRALRRQAEIPLSLADLPPIDIVLISHNHYDHLDAKTVETLKIFHPQIEWILPEKLSSWFSRRGIEKTHELSRWQTLAMKGCKITAVPAQHFSGRSLWDQNKTHWNGYVLETPSGKRFYFVGDTGYNPHDFKAIGARFPHMDLSLIPIGTYSPKKFMQPVHIGPEEAVQIHQEVRSRLSIGMHWNTFVLSDEPFDLPPYDLFLAMRKKKLPFEQFLPLEIGGRINW